MKLITNFSVSLPTALSPQGTLYKKFKRSGDRTFPSSASDVEMEEKIEETNEGKLKEPNAREGNEGAGAAFPLPANEWDGHERKQYTTGRKR